MIKFKWYCESMLGERLIWWRWWVEAVDSGYVRWWSVGWSHRQLRLFAAPTAGSLGDNIYHPPTGTVCTSLYFRNNKHRQMKKKMLVCERVDCRFMRVGLMVALGAPPSHWLSWHCWAPVRHTDADIFVSILPRPAGFIPILLSR